MGDLSSIDFLRLAERREHVINPAGPPLPITCSFQMKRRMADGRDGVQCTLAPGVCRIQAKQKGPAGEDLLVCSQPRSALVDWQVVEMEQLPEGEVRHFMTVDPVTVGPAAPIHDRAQMIDAHLHRLIVVDDERRPLGIVTSTDLLTALANNTKA